MTVDTTKSIEPIQQYGLEPGAKTPMESAQIKSANASAEQNANNQQAGSRRRRRSKSRSRSKSKSRRRRRLTGGKGDQPGPNEIVVPQPTTLVEPAGPVDANANTTATTGTLVNSAAQAEFDKLVGQTAGSRRRKRRRTHKNKRGKKSRRSKNGGKSNRKSKYTRRKRNNKSKR